MATYRAVIETPDGNQPKPDKHGTMTVHPGLTTFGVEPQPLQEWAFLVLPTCVHGAVCKIYKTQEVLLDTITQADVEKVLEQRKHHA